MPRAEMPAEHAVLGLLALGESQKQGYGYDLARQFSAGQPLADVLRLEPGMLYHHLKKLERVGWLAAEIEPQDARPSRRIYTLTAAGRTELRRWLRAPVARTREIRLEFLVKLYFARRLDVARAGQLIADQQETCRRLEASLVQQLSHLGTERDPRVDAEAVAFQRLVVELRLSQTRAAAAWLGDVVAAGAGSVEKMP